MTKIDPHGSQNICFCSEFLKVYDLSYYFYLITNFTEKNQLDILRDSLNPQFI